jgi:hypothetical protein
MTTQWPTELAERTYGEVLSIVLAGEPRRHTRRTRPYDEAACRLLRTSDGVPIEELVEDAETVCLGDFVVEAKSALARGDLPKRQRAALVEAFGRIERLWWAIEPVADVDFDRLAEGW